MEVGITAEKVIIAVYLMQDEEITTSFIGKKSCDDKLRINSLSGDLNLFTY